MKIVHISDTHGKHRELTNLPDADMIIHSGDFTFAGTDNEAIDFMDWYCDLPYMYKIFIAGNHDVCMQDATIEGLPQNVYFLNNTGITVDGIKIYGVPMAVEYEISGENIEHINNIPIDSNIVITHQPPYDILDFSDNIKYGSKTLKDKILSIKPMYHLFGHIHNSYGISNINGINFSNAATVDEAYNITNSPRLITIDI